MPEFGPYLKEKEERIASYKKTVDPLKEFPPENHRPPYKPTKPIPAVKVRMILLYLVVALENGVRSWRQIGLGTSCMKIHAILFR